MNNAWIKVLVVLVFQLAASTVGAAIVPDAPHDLGNGYRCSDCHTNHNTLGSTGYNNICLNCHNPADPKGGRKAFTQADMANPFGSFTSGTPAIVFQSSHNWASPDTNPAAGAQPPVQAAMTSNALRARTGGRLACVRCHNQHSQGNPPFLRMANDRDQLCLDCHRSRDRRDHTSGTHPVNFSYTSASSKVKTNPADYFPLPVNANPANPTSALPLKGGLVLCTSCHGVHFSDSNSATFDSFSSSASQNQSGGFLLRTDLRGASPDAVNICTSCHRGKKAHNLRGQNVQCADCHGGHVDTGDGSTPNVWLVNRFMNFSSALGSAKHRPVLFQSVTVKNYMAPDGSGVCQACHQVPTTAGYQTFHQVANNSSCNQCHNHNNPLGTFAVTPDAACNTCHGHPPTANTAGPGGYGNGYQNSPSFTDESQSGHTTHASAPYQKACENCHSGNNHIDGRFQDVFLVTAGTVAATGGVTPAYDTATQVCSNVYCHSNGNPRGGTLLLRSTPSWNSAKGGGKGAIVGKPDECATCHSAAGDPSPTWSASHTRHVNGYGANPNFTCNRCHAATASGNSAIFDTVTARSLHTNGIKDVVFAGFAASGTWDKNGATCSNLYCHSNVQGENGLGAPASFTPNLTWNAPAMTCGSCHAAMVRLNNVSSATGSHKTHVQRYPFSCAYCHGAGYSSDSVAVPSHVDGVIQIAFTGTPISNGSPASYYQGNNAPGGGYADCSNIYCHSSVQGPGGNGPATSFASPTWGSGPVPCGSCHANMATSAAATGSHVQHAQAAQLACSVCHSGAGKDPNPPFAPTILHANGVIDIAFSGSGAGTVYSTGSHTPGKGYGSCSGSSCHGGAAPAWGANTQRPVCDKCHGSAATNPFYSTAGASAATDAKTGAHTAHLFSLSAGAGHLLSGNVACSECHSVPAALTAPGHFDSNGSALVPLGGTLARAGGLSPSYDPVSRSCANTYCHGASPVTLGGSKTVPTWNVPLFTGDAAHDCALCHGYPPPSPIHAGKTPTACQGCHPHVNASGTGFVDPTKHINGVIEVHGAHDVPYYSHNTATSFAGCSGCHDVATPGPYPAPVAGDPPNCRGCHLAADPTVASVNCVSCHAKPPNGTTPPNVGGSHAKHQGIAATPTNCALCHTGAGSGSGANHGSSNRGSVPSVVNVVFGSFTAAKTGATSAYSAATQSCNNTYCHSSVQAVGGSGAATPLATPGWGNPLGCGGCHADMAASAAATGSHAAHAQPGGTVFACSVCHGSGYTATSAVYPSHVNRRIDLSFTGNAAGTAYSKGSSVMPGSAGYGSCSNNNCHGAMNPTWGNNSAKPRCQKCHGYRAPGWNALNGATAVSDAKAGVHFNHISSAGAGKYARAFSCAECHATSIALPGDNLNAAGHYDSPGPAEVSFGVLARTGNLAPSYSGGQCANTYCHGNTLDKPASAVLSPAWNQPFLTGAAANDCAKCHGYPPATAVHTGVTPTACHNCHPHVNASGTGFVDPGQHIDGVIEATGAHSFPFPGALHAAAANAAAPFSNCNGCHNTVTPGGSYPVPAGTPPFCTGCHLNATNFTGAAPGCYDCHGSGAGSGRPAGNVFPNFSGSHSKHAGMTGAPDNCAICHSGFGSGSLSHGSSNRIAATAASVKVSFNAQAGTGAAYDAIAHNCSGTYCHSSVQGATGTGAGTPVTTPAWGAPLTCGGCHADMATSAAATGSHAAHAQPSGTVYACAVCHGSGYTASSAVYPSHVNGRIDLAFSANAAGTGYSKGSSIVPGSAAYGSCSSNNCHGAGTPVWGNNTGKARCQKCHGYRSAGWNALNGATATSDAKAGTHFNHISSAGVLKFAKPFGCAECHVSSIALPGDNVNAAGHFDSAAPAEVSFSILARTGALTPTYSTGQCANTYCHGNTLDKPATAVLAPNWNQPFLTGVAANDCAKCHGYPPATAVHSGVVPTACKNCHPHVNASGTGFSDPGKHIDGIIEATGAHAFPYPGASHRSDANAKAPYTNCNGCHDATTPGGSYPVAAGTAPLCSACHVTTVNFNGTTPGCWDCHGASATDGRPNGTLFPNNDRNHTVHAAIAPGCSVCHLNAGSGTSSHGSSNRTAASEATVEVAFSATPAGPGVWNAASRTCSATLCHGQGAPTWGATGTAPVNGFPYSTVQCAKCHSGNLAGDVTAANPFYSTAIPKVTANTDAKVGAHTSHLTATDSLSNALACADCHGSVTLSAASHMNGSTNFSFNALAATGGLTPSYNASTGVCSNVYCHGAAMPGGDSTGSNRAPTWKSPFLPATLSAASCSGCHGFPPSPASGHPTGITIPAGFPNTASIGTTCSCHPNINPAGNSYANIFVNKALHIDGVLQVSLAAPHPVPNYNHQSAGTGASCTGCHAIGTASSVYPAPVAGNAPDCRGCHKKAAPGSATGSSATFGACGSCHGSLTATTAGAQGRPNGTAFPDRVGRHQGSGDSAHLTAACSKCHILTTSGTGSTVNHGPGNRGANPDIVGPGFVTGITITGAGKGVSPTATCNHSIINANNGGGCSGGPSNGTW